MKWTNEARSKNKGPWPIRAKRGILNISPQTLGMSSSSLPINSDRISADTRRRYLIKRLAHLPENSVVQYRIGIQILMHSSIYSFLLCFKTLALLQRRIQINWSYYHKEASGIEDRIPESVVVLNQSWGGGSLICCVCWLLWCNYSHRGWVQSTSDLLIMI